MSTPQNPTSGSSTYGRGTLEEKGRELGRKADTAAARMQSGIEQARGQAQETGSQLRNAYKHIGTAVGYTKKRREATTGVLGIAVVLVLLAAAASLRWTSRLP